MNELTKLWDRLQKRCPQYRRGQALYNACYDLYPDIALKFRGTDKDPFYVDDRIPAFLKEVEGVLNNDRKN